METQPEEVQGELLNQAKLRSLLLPLALPSSVLARPYYSHLRG